MPAENHYLVILASESACSDADAELSEISIYEYVGEPHQNAREISIDQGFWNTRTDNY